MGYANKSLKSFYSTQFVDQKDVPGGGHSIEYMENAWLFFAVSIPLTLFTIMVWYTWSNFGAILQMFVWAREERAVAFRERVRVMGLLRRRRELPR
jgi:hypothetical protein